jgi:hypothetical protein
MSPDDMNNDFAAKRGFIAGEAVKAAPTGVEILR